MLRSPGLRPYLWMCVDVGSSEATPVMCVEARPESDVSNVLSGQSGKWVRVHAIAHVWRPGDNLCATIRHRPLLSGRLACYV